MKFSGRTAFISWVVASVAAVVWAANLLSKTHTADLHAKQSAAAASITAETKALAASAQYRALAETATAARDSALDRANIAEKRATTLDAKYRVLASVAPDTCRPIVIYADSALAAKDSEAVELRVALRAAQDATSNYKAGLDTLRGASVSLVSSSKDLLVASKPTFVQRITPHVGFGAAVGVDATGVPRAILGVTLGWSF